MNDLRVLTGLRLRQWRVSLVPLLRLFGYRPEDRSLKEFFYNLYLLAFFVVWFIFGTWGAIIHQAAQLGAALSLPQREQIVNLLPWLFFLGLIGLSFKYARRSPVLLSFPDTAYLAGSPVPRHALVLVQWAQEVVRAMLIMLPFAIVTAVILAQPLPLSVRFWAPARAALATVPILLLVLIIAWLWGVIRLSVPRLAHWRGYKWLPLLLAAALLFMPSLALWPGRFWLDALSGSWPPGLAGLFIASVGLLLGLLGISGRLNLIAVSDESVVFAQMQALGAFSRLSPDFAVVRQNIKRQSVVVGKRPFLYLPTSSGARTLLLRSGLVTLREGSGLFALAGWGGIFSGAAQLIVLNDAPVEFWIYWLLGVLLLPPRQLIAVFQADLREPFLRQLLPLSNWQLLVFDTAVPFIAILTGALGAWLIQPAISLALIILVSLLLVLCLGLPLFSLTHRQIHVPYPVWVLITIAPVIAAALFW